MRKGQLGERDRCKRVLPDLNNRLDLLFRNLSHFLPAGIGLVQVFPASCRSSAGAQPARDGAALAAPIPAARKSVAGAHQGHRGGLRKPDFHQQRKLVKQQRRRSPRGFQQLNENVTLFV